MDPKSSWEGLDWIYRFQDRNNLWDIVNAVINLGFVKGV